MTILEQLVAAPKPTAWAALIKQHTPSTAAGHMAEWGRKGNSHYKDGQFSKA